MWYNKRSKREKCITQIMFMYGNDMLLVNFYQKDIYQWYMRHMHFHNLLEHTMD